MSFTIAGIDYELIRQKLLQALTDPSNVFAKDATLSLLLQALGFLPRRTIASIQWVYGSIVSAPAAGTALTSFSVPTGRQGYIYGYMITASEANTFEIRWTSGGTARSIRIAFPGAGTIHGMLLVALNEGLPADGGTSISIVNVNAGTTGSYYQAGLLVVVV